jgi:hypothetical protein
MSDTQRPDSSPVALALGPDAAATPTTMTLEDAERAYREQWGVLGERAWAALLAFCGDDPARLIELVRRSIAAPPEAFAAFYQSAMRDAIARGLVPPGGSGWAGPGAALRFNREAN